MRNEWRLVGYLAVLLALSPVAGAAPDGTYWMETDAAKFKIQLKNDKVVAEWSFPKAGAPSEGGQPSASSERRAGDSILAVTVKNKHFQDSNFRAGIVNDGIWWDLTVRGVGLKKAARAIKGVLVFSDLFGEPKIKINWTLEKGLAPGAEITEKGVGIDYNQFMSPHQWLKSTSLDDMKVSFVVTQILYTDGTTESLAP